VLLDLLVIPIELLGAYAVNKKRDQKERQLILDDLDIELEMLEKEIQEADSQGQMKKLRALLTTKKQIQRTYQRVKYKMKLGKNLFADAQTGVKEYE
jgi:hypothetical protein